MKLVVFLVFLLACNEKKVVETEYVEVSSADQETPVVEELPPPAPAPVKQQPTTPTENKVAEDIEMPDPEPVITTKEVNFQILSSIHIANSSDYCFYMKARGLYPATFPDSNCSLDYVINGNNKLYKPLMMQVKFTLQDGEIVGATCKASTAIQYTSTVVEIEGEYLPDAKVCAVIMLDFTDGYRMDLYLESEVNRVSASTFIMFHLDEVFFWNLDITSGLSTLYTDHI